MQISRNKKIAAALSTAAIAVAGGGIAFAYWTSGGSGTGSINAASAPTALALTGTSADALAPGGNGSLSVSAHNPNSYGVVFGSHTLSISNVAADAGHSACTSALAALSVDAAHNSINNTTNIPGGGDLTVGSIQIDMANLPSTDQSACEGATFTFDLAES